VGINLWSTSSLLATPAALVWRTCTTSALYSAAYGRKDAHHFTCSAHTGALVSVCCVYTLQGQHTHEAYTGDRTKEAFETFADSLVPTAGQPEVKHVDLKSAPRASGCNVAGAHMAQPHCLRCRLSGTAADVVHGRLKVFVQPLRCSQQPVCQHLSSGYPCSCISHSVLCCLMLLVAYGKKGARAASASRHRLNPTGRDIYVKS
jgi:hypothetical protein